MKKLIYNVLAVVSISFGVVSCVKEVEPYTPAEKPSGDQVFFHKDLKTSFEATDSTLFWNEEAQAWSNTIKLAFQRVVSDQARTVAIKCDPDTTITKDVFTCPETVDFAAGESVAYAEIGFDRDKLLANLAKDFTVTVTITEKDHVSPYGKTSVTLSIVYPDPKPWIKWDKGVLTEGWWGEKEPAKEMYYQQINDSIRFCKIEKCFGHDTIEKGEPYEVQDYVWYWNTNTNKCYVPCRYMGYMYQDTYPVYYGDQPSFYNDYWGYYYAEGSETWFKFNDLFRSNYPDDYYPYYDGNGGFYLADQIIVGLTKTGNYQGRLSSGSPYDTFIGGSFTRTTDYNKDLEYEPFADGIDKSSLWKAEFPIQVQVAEDPNSVEETPSQVWYIPGYVNDTTGIAFIVVASDADPAKAKWSITDAANTQYTDHNVFGKKLGYNVIGRKSSITGVPGEYPCEIELCINANLYDVEYDEKGKAEYTLAYALGEFVDKITLTNATEVWYNADQLQGLKKEYYVDNYVLYAKDFFKGEDVSWNVSVEDAGVIEETSYLKFKSLVPYPSYLPQNEFLVEWYSGYLYFAADTMLGKFHYGEQELDVTLYPFSSKTEEYYDNAYLLGGYYINDEQTYECVPFVDYPYDESPVDGFYADVEEIGGLCAFYQICMEFAAPAATSSAKKSFVPAKYEVHTLSEVKALRSASVARANFRIPMAVSQAERHAEKVKVNRHSGSIDTSNARKVEKNLTPVQVQLKNNIRF